MSGGVKAVISVIVYLFLVTALALVTLFTSRPDPADGLVDDE